MPKSDPYIEGNKHKYSPGELVELNCTSNSSDPEADLFWYINALPVSHTPLWSILLNFDQNILLLQFSVSNGRGQCKFSWQRVRSSYRTTGQAQNLAQGWDGIFTACFRLFFPFLEHLCFVLEHLFFCFRTYFFCFFDFLGGWFYLGCPGIEGFVPGHLILSLYQDKIFLSQDKGTMGRPILWKHYFNCVNILPVRQMLFL